MGYMTEFEGRFILSPVLTVAQYSTLRRLAEDDEAWRKPESGKPHSRLQWVPSDDGQGLEWDRCEKFYYYRSWLQWLIDNPLREWGLSISGSVIYSGESQGDKGILTVVDGKAIKQNFIFKPFEMGPKDFAEKMLGYREKQDLASASELMASILSGFGYMEGAETFLQLFKEYRP